MKIRLKLTIIILVVGLLVILFFSLKQQPLHSPKTYTAKGIIEIYFSPEYILGDAPADTDRNIHNFINSTNLPINIKSINDGNMISFIVVWEEGLNQDSDLIDRVKNDSLVSSFTKSFYIESPSGSGPTYKISFKGGIYTKTLRDFLDKYPIIKNSLYLDYTPLSFQSVMVVAKVPIGEEDQYINELKIKYPNELLEVKRQTYFRGIL